MPTPSPALRLTYSFATFPAPLPISQPNVQERAKLTIVATNLTAEPVQIAELIIDLPVGPAAGQLTNNADSLRVTAPLNWRYDPSSPAGLKCYKFLPPGTGAFTLDKNQALTFVFEELEPNTVAGTSQVLVHEGGKTPARKPEDLPIKVLEVTKFSPSWGRLTFVLDKLHVRAGEEVKLSWKGPAGPTYQLQYQSYASDDSVTVKLPQPGQQPFRNEGSYPGAGDQPRLKPMRPTTYTLIVTDTFEGAPRTAQMQLTVDVTPVPVPPVPAPRIVEFRTEPSLVITSQPIPPIKLVWQAEDASSLTFITAEARALQGSMPIYPVKSQKYSAVAYPLPNYKGGGPALKTTSVVFAEAIPVLNNAVRLKSGEVLLKTGQVSTGHKTDKQGVTTDKSDLVLLLQPGFEIAELGNFGPHPTLTSPNLNTVTQAAYRPALANNCYCKQEVISTFVDFKVAYTPTMGVGHTWGIKLSANKFGVLWISAASNGEVAFNWVLCDEAYQVAETADADSVPPAHIAAAPLGPEA